MKDKYLSGCVAKVPAGPVAKADALAFLAVFTKLLKKMAHQRNYCRWLSLGISAFSENTLEDVACYFSIARMRFKRIVRRPGSQGCAGNCWLLRP
ncbi:hypothetical protein [Polaromonas sp.]|uniref:hypothetical protein n=1 Tax=Polaromonas sp. TaxID=1869339 RepID=UPI0013B925E6|nr:hypothetical protein [Polaromonas sp.]NDP64791.1 hypothetical protein [Polaromonas sp.]